MSDTIKTLFQYLDSEKIILNQKEFDYQLKSHPDYPSLLAISDTLNFFNINNAALRVPKEKFELLPNVFLANLRESNGSFLSVINKEDENITYTTSEKDSKEELISREEFLNKWDEIVLLAEKDEVDEISIKAKSKNKWMFFVLPLILITSIVLYSDITNYWLLFFIILPISGIVLSIGALSDVFNTDSRVLSKICGSGGGSGKCNSVVNSNKWKVFSKISFSDLSIVFFSVQLFALILFALLDKYEQFYLIQVILLCLSVPVVLLSFYYQKFVEKKWCSICLLIILVVLLELIYVVVLIGGFKYNLSAFSIILFSFITLLLYCIWFPLKRILTENKNLKETELKANRFKRNFQLFKNTLLTEKKNELPKSLLTIGNPDARIKIAILTSPFCGFCETPHKILKAIKEKHDDIEVSIIFNVPSSDENFRTIAKNLIQLKLDSGEESYYEAMDYWYKTNDLNAWLLKYRKETIEDRVGDSLKNQQLWCYENQYNFTPCLFVNGRKYPDLYDNSDLEFFIDELKEDLDLC